MRKILLLILTTLSITAYGQIPQYPKGYWGNTLPTGSSPATVIFRVRGTDSLKTPTLSIGGVYYDFPTVTEMVRYINTYTLTTSKATNGITYTDSLRLGGIVTRPTYVKSVGGSTPIVLQNKTGNQKALFAVFSGSSIVQATDTVTNHNSGIFVNSQAIALQSTNGSTGVTRGFGVSIDSASYSSSDNKPIRNVGNYPPVNSNDLTDKRYVDGIKNNPDITGYSTYNFTRGTVADSVGQGSANGANFKATESHYGAFQFISNKGALLIKNTYTNAAVTDTSLFRNNVLTIWNAGAPTAGYLPPSAINFLNTPGNEMGATGYSGVTTHFGGDFDNTYYNAMFFTASLPYYKGFQQNAYYINHTQPTRLVLATEGANHFNIFRAIPTISIESNRDVKILNDEADSIVVFKGNGGAGTFYKPMTFAQQVQGGQGFNSANFPYGYHIGGQRVLIADGTNVVFFPVSSGGEIGGNNFANTFQNFGFKDNGDGFVRGKFTAMNLTNIRPDADFTHASPPTATSTGKKGDVWYDTVSKDKYEWVADNSVAMYSVMGKLPYAAIAATYSVLPTDYYLDCNGSFTATLPTSIAGKTFEILNTGAGTVTIAATGGQLVNGSTTYNIAAGSAYKFIGTGTSYLVKY